MIPIRNTCFLNALVLVVTIAGAGTTALAQTTSSSRTAPPPRTMPQAQRATDRKVSETEQPVAHYNIGHIVKRLAAVEAQAEELKKQNAALANQIAEMKQKDALTSKNVNTMKVAGTSAQERLNRLEETLRNHTHYMPNIGITALSALPGMQDIAGKAGVGHVIEQWKGIKMHVSFGNGGDLGRTGTVVPSQ